MGTSLYEYKNSPIHQLNPLTKLAVTGLLLTAALLLPGVWINYLLFAATLLPLAALAKVTRPLLNRVWKIVLPFAISVFLIQGLFWPQGTPIFTLGPFSVKQEGLVFAITSTGRILMIVASFLWFSLTTRPDHLMNSLSQTGFPAALAYVIVATIQIAPRFQARATTILDAQRARGVETEGGWGIRLRALVPLVIPLILSSLVDVEERALAVEARGFNHPGRKTSLVDIPDAGWERGARWIILAAILGVIGLRLVMMVQMILA